MCRWWWGSELLYFIVEGEYRTGGWDGRMIRGEGRPGVGKVRRVRVSDEMEEAEGEGNGGDVVEVMRCDGWWCWWWWCIGWWCRIDVRGVVLGGGGGGGGVEGIACADGGGGRRGAG